MNIFNVMEALLNNTDDITNIKSNLGDKKYQGDEIKISLPQRLCFSYHLEFGKDYSEEFVLEAAYSKIDVERLKNDITNQLYENSVNGIEKWLKKNERYHGGTLKYKGFSIGDTWGDGKGLKINYATMNDG